MLLQITYQDKTTQTEKENTIEDIKAITTLCIKVKSMDNEIQKLKSKASISQQHDYKNAELRRSEDKKIPEIEGDVGKLPKTHNICSITTAGTSRKELANNYLNGNAIWSYCFRDQLMIYSNSRELRKADIDEVQRWILSLLKSEERPTTRALKTRFISAKLLTRYCKLIGHKYLDHICSKCNGEDNVIPDVQLE
ncbi:hypothetical protein H5410_057089 [Solanum commersonii]|uniref:Uncharacterized protein n=1 Tax=Solanum commersonii TaxID=4109 RepID=A0A9J5WM05_SOLCO|nr:hypothetical protein H5410_057089 [Solanum commersonii]